MVYSQARNEKRTLVATHEALELREVPVYEPRQGFLVPKLHGRTYPTQRSYTPGWLAGSMPIWPRARRSVRGSPKPR